MKTANHVYDGRGHTKEHYERYRAKNKKLLRKHKRVLQSNGQVPADKYAQKHNLPLLLKKNVHPLT